MTKGNIRAILKSLTYKSLSTISTFAAGWLITGDFTIGMTLGIFEITFKLLLYFVHEKVWFNINYGMKYSKNKKDSKLLTHDHLIQQGFQETEDENRLILSLSENIDLVATKRKRKSNKKTYFKVKIGDTMLGLCKNRGELRLLIKSLTR
tara:strand:- start:519 stop:968 length:450 start_codon:yes stop_codon:yes gene_type:complete